MQPLEKHFLIFSEKEAANSFWLLFDLNAFPLSVSNIDGTIHLANNLFYEMLGYTEDEFHKKGITWKDITPEEYQFMDERCINELKDIGTGRPFEKEFIRKDGSRIKVRVYVGTTDLREGKTVSITIPI